MTDKAPVETTNLGSADQTTLEWTRPRDFLAAPPPPDTPGGHFPSYLGTVRPNGRPHVTGIGARWYDGDIYFLSGPGTRKSRNLAVNPACAIAMHLEGLELVLDGEATPVDDPAILDAVGALIRRSGWPVELTADGFTAPFGPPDLGPPWTLYRFVFHTAIGQDESGALAGASRAKRSNQVRRRIVALQYTHDSEDTMNDALNTTTIRRQSRCSTTRALRSLILTGRQGVAGGGSRGY